MNGEGIPPRADWPSIRWRWAGWLGGSASILAIVVFLWPELTGLGFRRRIAAGVAIFATPIILVVGRFAVASLFVAARRLREYSAVYDALEANLAFSETIQKHLSELMRERTRFEISKVRWDEHKNAMYVLLRKKGESQPSIGSTFSAYDMEDETLMAELELIGTLAEGHLTRISGYIDPLWLGDVRARNQPELPPPPMVFAFLRSRI